MTSQPGNSCMQPLLIDDVRRHCDDARSIDVGINEAETEARLVLPLLRLLGWSESGQAAIRRQVASHGVFADIHLVLDDRALCVIEVKRRSLRLFVDGRHPRDGVLAALTTSGRDTFDQAVRYALADGIPSVWITNGVEHLVFRVQQTGVPIESRLIFTASEAEGLVARFDDLHKLSPTAFEALQLVDTMPPPAMSSASVYDRLVELCDAASSSQLGWLVDGAHGTASARPTLKYSRAVFVPRDRYETIFDEFWRADPPMLVFTGEAGIGKTSLLCHLALTLHDRVGRVPAIFLDAFHLGHGLLPALGHILERFTSVDQLHGLDIAIEAVETQVLSQQPFKNLLRPSEARKKTSAAALRALLSQLTESGVRHGVNTFRELAVWASECAADDALMERLHWVSRVPEPDERKGLLDIDGREARYRYSAQLDKFAEELLATASQGAKSLWKAVHGRTDSTFLDYVDAVALLHASRTQAVDTTAVTLLRQLASESWLTALAARLRDASGADLVAASPAARRAFAQLLSLTDVPKLLLMVDAINESPHPGDLRAEIIEVANLFQGRLAKLVLSCRTPDMQFFMSDAFRSFRYGHDHPAMALDTFAMNEFAAAWKLYSAAYDIAGTPGPALTELCRQPLILRITCESYAGQLVPEDDIRLIEIFDGYWQRKVAGGADGFARALVLHDLAEIARRHAATRD